jgi:hypothetical protein
VAATVGKPLFTAHTVLNRVFGISYHPMVKGIDCASAEVWKSIKIVANTNLVKSRRERRAICLSSILFNC